MLEVHGLSCNYGTASILDDVSIEVRDGEVLALLGRNGMGKTTLVRALAGIDPPQVVAGSIIYDGEELLGLESYQVSRKGIGYVPQGRHIFGSLTVVENLEIIARPPHNGEEPWTVSRVFDFFPRLAERRSSFGRNLSGGEQQMLAIGRSLMADPRVLLLDEPSMGLAPILLKTIRERLEGLKGSNLSILLVEQNLGLATALGDRINIMAEHGNIVWQGSPAELEADAATKQRHLGV